ncbi:nucleotidyltransferase family protein [Thalassotalea sp. 1_MG-2023]|uniref:N-acetylmuramate alpha-1-phosphate uridylyltransferase MurU n=1 Tax=Thalassotalea sp. 1_MG-2023 TaxID=3062680 RepID=UPI0026E459EF|nr:nucleotidyltransferase family protein [Thalassotalea sp. 1_MG-2023]MDO6427081.1 nucleotidyltransferase family protein [Thalassotalea sp. 1_MG-2023]
MKVMILAAGRGERMRPLTDSLPKPMLSVAGKPLIVHHIEKLRQAGFREFVINTAWLGDKIVACLKDGRQLGVSIVYSHEGEQALETAGGICQALPFLDNNNAPFLVVNGDIYVDYHFNDIPKLAEQIQAHLWLVKNPEHNPLGDFNLEDEQVSNNGDAASRYTYSGIGIYRASLFSTCQKGQPAKLAPLLRDAINQQTVSGSVLPSNWTDVGTPERLALLNKELEGFY